MVMNLPNQAISVKSAISPSHGVLGRSINSGTTIQNPKTLNRPTRIKLAKVWATQNSTKKKIRDYMKFFGVDKLCAAKELTLAGIELHEKHAVKWATRHERKALAKKNKKRTKKNGPSPSAPPFDSDYYHYYIAGYTAGGFPYGITWEEAEERGLIEAR